jgi:hypothetical protein
MIKAASTSKTSVNFFQTKLRNIPEDSYLHSHKGLCSFGVSLEECSRCLF